MRRFASGILVLLAAITVATVAQPTWSDPYAATRKQMTIQAFGDHFSLGQSPSNIAWYNDTFTNNNCKWDFHVQYLSGGPPFPGAPSPWDRLPWWQYYSDFPTISLQNLAKLKKPMLSWFTFYAMAQGYPGMYGDCSAPAPIACGGPAKSTPWNAHNSTYMFQYFSLFKTLMQKVGAFPTVPVAIHIEPDGWGHILLNGTYTWPNLDPNTTFVYVGGSGHPELTGFPDNIIGWARAFKKLRDTYAGKNALLICNPSGWDSTGTMTGARFGAIMKQLAGDWEGAVFETGDRDKGSPGSNKNPPYVDSGGVPTIAITGNFDKHVNWIKDFNNASGLPVFVWQAASGNTIYRTCNQSDKHYMDNLIQTLLGGYPADKTWVSRYVDAGCYGWMFNPGQGFSTHVDDAAADGITNPPAAANNTGLTSIYADDDGGYTRLRGQAYYADPYSLLGIFPGTVAPTNPATAAAAADTTTSAASTSTLAVTSSTSTTAVTSTAFAAGGASSTSTAASSTSADAAVTSAASTTAVASTASAATTTTTAAAASPTTGSNINNGGAAKLSSGAIAGIVIGVLVLIAVVVALLVYLLVFRTKKEFVIRA